MSVAGDQLETYALMLDGGGDPQTGLTLTYLSFIGPDEVAISTSRLDWEELTGGEYVVRFQTTTSDTLGQYYLTFQFNDADESIWTETWDLGSTPLTIYPATATPLQTGTPQNVAPHQRDDDDTHDSQYWRRDEEPTPGPHVHVTAGDVVAFVDTSSINFEQTGTNVTAAAIFGTTAGTVAQGSALAAKADTSSLATVATSGLYADLLSKPTTFTPATHAHAGEDITSGTIPFARLSTGTSGATVAVGNHTHTITDTWNIPLGATGAGVIATGVYIDIIIPYNMTLAGNWTLVAMQSGAIVLDLWVRDLTLFPPTVSQTIVGGGGTKPTITATSNKAQGNYTGWADTTLTVGNVLRINVDSRATIEQVTLALDHTRGI